MAMESDSMQDYSNRSRIARMPMPDRFWVRVDKESDPGGCWLWVGTIGSDGYGYLIISGKERKAHRVSYELSVGEIPNGLELDHVKKRGCLHRHCVNPDHLEAVSPLENWRRGDSLPAINSRKTHCPDGHPYDSANTWVSSSGWRHCRQCHRIREDKRYHEGKRKDKKPKVR